MIFEPADLRSAGFLYGLRRRASAPILLRRSERQPMQIVRFLSGGQIHLGQRINDATALEIEGDLLGEYHVTGRELRIEKLLAPLVPSDILCIGLNYREHAAESGSEIPTNPMLFIKSGNALN